MAESLTDVPGIAIVRSSRGWARTLHRYVVDHGGAIVRTRPLEERQALEDEYDILIVDDISSFLTAHIIEELHRRGRRILGVFDPDDHPASTDSGGRERLERLGVDSIIEASASPEEFVRFIEDLAPSVRSRPAYHHDEDDFALPSSSLELGVDNLPLALPSADELRAGGTLTQSPNRTPALRRRGHITTVFGASGGGGSTEVAVELARALGRRGERTIVVDGDELAPSLAQRLDLALHPNIRTAVDVVEHGTGRLSECLTQVGTNLEVLTGLPHPKDWIELRGNDMIAVLEELARGRPHVVVNASPFIEDLTMFGAADRFGMSRAAVAIADLIVVVCSPTPTGISRLIDRAADLDELTEGRPIHVVVNRMPKGVFKRNEIAREIERSFSPAGIHFLPTDPKVDRAAWDGTLVPAGEFTKAIHATLLPAIPKATMVGGATGHLVGGATGRRDALHHTQRGA